MAEDRQQEIDEIMNEIQSLQAGMAAVSAPQAGEAQAPAPVASAAQPEVKPMAMTQASAPTELADFHASGSDAPMEDTLADVKDESEHLVAAMDETDHEEITMSQDLENDDSTETDGSEDGSLTLSLKGRMTLKLKYECDGQEIVVGFSDGCLKVQLADGTEFKVPVSRQKKTARLRVA